MSFKEKVFDAVARIPKGRVATYGQVAFMAGSPGASRAVGNAIHTNTDPVAVPCHRVVCADGSLGSNYGLGGPEMQRIRLESEGIAFETESMRVNLDRYGISIEEHPLQPFLPPNAEILFLGSFPPPKIRWSMDFFYPNWINDFWRIQGLIHFGDAKYFESGKCFDRQLIVDFCEKNAFAFYDTAGMVFRLKGNASDNFLYVLKPADIGALLLKLPNCHTIVTTGGKASDELLNIIQLERRRVDLNSPHSEAAHISVPAVGAFSEMIISDRHIRWWRMPSTSRAYPMSLKLKADHYRKIFDFLPCESD